MNTLKIILIFIGLTNFYCSSQWNNRVPNYSFENISSSYPKATDSNISNVWGKFTTITQWNLLYYRH